MKTSSSFRHLFPVGAFGLAIVLLSAPEVLAQTNETRGDFSRADFKFASAAAAGGKMEVDLGRIAAQKTTLPAIKDFGQQMVTDHGKAGAKLEGIATEQHAVLPAAPTAKQQKEIDHLNSLSGAEFDRAYVSMMVDDHKKDLKEFQNAAKNADNPQLRAFANETASTVQHHLEMVQALNAELKAKK